MKYGLGEKEIEAFCNDDARLREKAANVLDERSAAGLDGLTGGLDNVIINVEPERLQAAAEEWIRYSGFSVSGGFENDEARTLVLKAPNSADVLIRTRLRGANPFESVNRAPKSAHLPNTRVETFVFETSDIDAYVEIQRGRGVRFLSDSPLRTEHCAFIQTAPSPYTGNSIGVIQWIGDRGRYEGIGDSVFDARVVPPRGAHTDSIGLLDHAATRVVAVNRDPAIIEFMWLTNYRFEFALHIAELNSITSVTRLPGADFAMVFTSGIRRADGMEGDGPTEQFVRNYGPRVHHIALRAESIDEVYAALKEDGLEFLSDLIGSPEEGLKQAFSVPSPHTLAVTEYIHRYGGFDGFFTRSNVAQLTEATSRQ